MKQENKKRGLDRLAVITTIVCLLPIIFSAVVYRDLPDQMAIHWGPNNQPDGWATKAFAAFGLPVFLAVLNLLCHIGSNRAGQAERQPSFLVLVCKWFPALLSVILTPITLLIALGKEIDVGGIVCLIIGVMMLLVGNYLPKCRQNRTMGIKLPWTLANEENWDKTHRMGGFLWILSGVLIIAVSFFRSLVPCLDWLMVAFLFLVILAPVVYSYVLHRKGL